MPVNYQRGKAESQAPKITACKRDKMDETTTNKDKKTCKENPGAV